MYIHRCIYFLLAMALLVYIYIYIVALTLDRIAAMALLKSVCSRAQLL